jgi:hypothetical protein
MRTLETGAGFSTIIFAGKGCNHTVIMPDQPLADRITAYCAGHNIDASGVSFVVASSTDAIHKQQPGYDLILIDGTHAFPAALVDFYYATKLLKLGGTLIVDDMHIYTCHLIASFMKEDPGWRLELMNDRVAFGTKVADTIDDDWSVQQFVRRRSPGVPSFTRPLLAARAVLGVLRSAGFSAAAKKIISKVRNT